MKEIFESVEKPRITPNRKRSLFSDRFELEIRMENAAINQSVETLSVFPSANVFVRNVEVAIRNNTNFAESRVRANWWQISQTARKSMIPEIRMYARIPISPANMKTEALFTSITALPCRKDS
jgi:hypothetical protein